MEGRELWWRYDDCYDDCDSYCDSYSHDHCYHYCYYCTNASTAKVLFHTIHYCHNDGCACVAIQYTTSNPSIAFPHNDDCTRVCDHGFCD